MLRLLANENIPGKLVTLLKKHCVDVARLQDLGIWGSGDNRLKSIINIKFSLTS